MKNLFAIFTIFLALVLSGLLFAQKTFSQGEKEFDFNRAYQDYIYNFDVYRNTNNDYEAARAQYLKFGTLKSKETAREATLAMLEARDTVVETYLTALRIKLLKMQGVRQDIKEVLFVKIDAEVAWFANHKEKLSSAATVEDLVDDSAKASKRYESINPLFYKTLAVISAGKVKNVRERQEEILDSISSKVSQIKNDEREEYKFSDRKIAIIERWILEVENRFRRSEEKEVEALVKIDEMKSGKKNELQAYNQAQFRFEESLQYLKEANPFLKEIIREVKTAE